MEMAGSSDASSLGGGLAGMMMNATTKAEPDEVEADENAGYREFPPEAPEFPEAPAPAPELTLPNEEENTEGEGGDVVESIKSQAEAIAALMPEDGEGKEEVSCGQSQPTLSTNDYVHDHKPDCRWTTGN